MDARAPLCNIGPFEITHLKINRWLLFALRFMLFFILFQIMAEFAIFESEMIIQILIWTVMILFVDDVIELFLGHIPGVGQNT